MGKLLEWLTVKFHHPLVPLFFVLGALLLVVGLAQKVPWIGEIFMDTEFRYVAVIMGTACLCISLFVYYKPPSRFDASGTGSGAASPPAPDATTEQGHSTMPSEWSLDWTIRRDHLSDSQRRLLRHIEQEKSASFSTLREQFVSTPSKELFYRLEQLRLLGFLECTRLGQGNDASLLIYQLTEEYRRQLAERGPEIQTQVTSIHPEASHTVR